MAHHSNLHNLPKGKRLWDKLHTYSGGGYMFWSALTNSKGHLVNNTIDEIAGAMVIHDIWNPLALRILDLR